MFYLGEGVLEPGPSPSPMLAFLKILEFKREETQHQLLRSIGALTERAASQRLVPPPGGGGLAQILFLWHVTTLTKMKRKQDKCDMIQPLALPSVLARRTSSRARGGGGNQSGHPGRFLK